MLSDPIAALATPPGRSALAVIRLSGAGAFGVAARVIDGFRADRPRIATLATFHDSAGEPIDRGLYTAFPGPDSYTGDDLVELSCHGGLLAPARVLSALHDAGARPAAPGEFTRRAVINGKLDLIQAEAVGDLIDAVAPAQAQAALRQLDGGLSRRLAELRRALVETEGLLVYEIDFREYDGPCRDTGKVGGRMVGSRVLPPLLRRPHAKARCWCSPVVPAGKSSLFNALLGSERALVTEVPGTTRDTIEAHTDFLGWPVRLADTAGLWESRDRIDRMGIEVSRRYLAAADLVLLCVESGRPVEPDEAAVAAERPCLVIRTKGDLATNGNGTGLGVSVVTGNGIADLRRAAAERVFGDRMALGDLEPALPRRHRVALLRARDALAEAVPNSSRWRGARRPSCLRGDRARRAAQG
jgi:tRNA modification GTPase